MQSFKESLNSFLDSPARRAAAWTGAALLGVLLALFALHKLPWHVTGEGFADFVYPYLYSWKDSIWHFFMERDRARLMHGVLVTALYAVAGYNPPVFYVAAQALTVLGATAFGLLAAPLVKKPWMAALVVVTAALLPLALQDMLVLKKLHHALSWSLFWWACVCFVEWARSGKRAWLLGTLLFPLSVLAYEAVGLLFPVAFLLALPYLKDRKDVWGKLGAAFVINLAGVLTFWLLEQLKPAGRAADSFYAGGMGNLLGRLASLPAGIAAIVKAIAEGQLASVYVANGGWLATLGSLALGAAVIGGLWAAVAQARKSGWKLETLLSPAVALTLAGLWMALATYIPFLLAGQPPENDGLRGAALGAILLAAAAAVGLAKAKGRAWLAGAFAVVCAVWIVTGASGYVTGLETAYKNSAWVNNYVLSIKEQVPAIKEDAVIVVLNSSISKSGCGPLHNMIFNRRTLRCLRLADNDTEDVFVRVEGWMEQPSTGGRYENDTVIVQFDDRGQVTLVPEVTEAAYPELPITWAVDDPLVTVYEIIYPEDYESGLRSRLYEYALGFAGE